MHRKPTASLDGPVPGYEPAPVSARVYRNSRIPIGNGNPDNFATISGYASKYPAVQISIDSGASNFITSGTPNEMRALAAAIYDTADATDAETTTRAA